MRIRRIRRIRRNALCLLVWMLAPCAAVLAPDASQEQDETALAKQIQNPVADLISFPFQSNIFFNIGENDRTA